MLTYIVTYDGIILQKVWSIFKESGLSAEVEQVFYQSFGACPIGSRVELNNGKFALVTASSGDEVEEVVIVSGGHNPLKATVGERLAVSTSPVQVERLITDPRDKTYHMRRLEH